MSFLERIGNLTQRFLTIDVEMKKLEQEQDQPRQIVERLDQKLQSLEHRVLQLEARHDADRREIEAMITRFQLEVERAELRLSRQLAPANAEN